jgi:hypothetical protein
MLARLHVIRRSEFRSVSLNPLELNGFQDSTCPPVNEFRLETVASLAFDTLVRQDVPNANGTVGGYMADSNSRLNELDLSTVHRTLPKI